MDQTMMYLPGILLAYSAFLLSIMSPGPNVLAIMGTSMAVSRRAGLGLALGVAAGSFCWAVLTAAGLAAIISAYAQALLVIKIAGGLYLLWLAWKSFRSAMSAHDIDAAEPAGGRRNPIAYSFRGFVIQMTNPKAALAWIAIISLGLQDGAPFWVGLAIVAGTTLLSVVLHCTYAMLFSTPVAVRIYAGARRWIQGALAACFAFAGVKLLTTRI